VDRGVLARRDALTTLATSGGPVPLVTLQCDVCCPPFINTNPLQQLEDAGWLTRAGGHPLDVCHVCHRRKDPSQLLPRASNPPEPLSSPGALPNFVIIGSAKCGTTSLHSWLDSHPDISMSVIKEPQYFADPEGFRWREYYESLFDPSAAVRGEASTCYTRDPAIPGVPERMAAAVPDAKLLFMVRDPVERALSSYVEERTHSGELRTPEEAFADLGYESNPYVAASRYAAQLERYLAHFPEEQVMVMDLADLRHHQAEAMVRICRFLGVDDAYEFSSAIERLNRSEQKREYPAVVRRLRGTGVLRHAYKLPPEHRERLLQPLRIALSRRVRRPVVSAETAARLADEFREDVRQLRALTGQSFAGWSV
jgi:hypothetical protein